MKQNFDRTKRLGLNIKEDYFKITNLLQVKIIESFKGLKIMIWLPLYIILSICYRMLKQKWTW
jgi:hypothetical protein